MRKILVILVILVPFFLYACQSKQQTLRLEDVESPWVSLAVIEGPLLSDTHLGLYTLVLAYDGRVLKKVVYPTGALVTIQGELVAIDVFSGRFKDEEQDVELSDTHWVKLSWSKFGTTIPFVEPIAKEQEYQILEEFERIHRIESDRIIIYNYQLFLDESANEIIREHYYSYDLNVSRYDQIPELLENENLFPTPDTIIPLDADFGLTVNALGQVILIKGTRNPVVVDALYQMGIHESIQQFYTIPIELYKDLMVSYFESLGANSFLWNSHRRMYKASEFMAMDRDSLESALGEIYRRYGLDYFDESVDYNAIERHNIELILGNLESKDGQLYDFSEKGDYLWVELTYLPDTELGRITIDDVSLTLPELTGTESFFIVKNSDNQPRLIVSYYGDKPSENGTYILKWDSEEREIIVSAIIPGIIYKDPNGTLKRDVFIEWPEGLLAMTDFYLVSDENLKQVVLEQTIFKISSFHYVIGDFEWPSVDQADSVVAFKKGEEVEFVATDAQEWVRVMKRNGQMINVDKSALDLFD